MCATIRPLPGAQLNLIIGPLLGAHRFNFLQVRPFRKTPTISSHQNLISGHLVTPSPRSGSPKCARLSPPSMGRLF